MSLFPVWLFGYWMYKYQWHKNVSNISGYLFLIIGSIGLILSPEVRQLLSIPENEYLRRSVLGDNLDGVFFCLTFIGIYSSTKHVMFQSSALIKIIRYLAALTFSLYLFHMPLFGLFTWIGGEEPDTIFQRTMVIVGTFIVVMIVGTWCEKQKGYYRKLIERLFPAKS